MRKRTKFKSPVLDFFVVTVCLSVAGYFAWTFWKDLNSTARRTDKEEIATITFKNRIAQRKFEDRVVWERIEKSTPLYNGDLVKTAELAEAVITFNDGSQIDIYENTMIQVYYSDYEGVHISVGNGKLQLDSSKDSKVQLTLNDGSTINAGGGTSLSAKTSAAGASGANNKTVQVRSGNATVTGSSGSTESISAGQSVSVRDGGEISKKPVTVTSIPPEMKVLNIEGQEVPVKLEWNKIQSDEPIILQTSTKKDFSVITEEKVITSQNDALLNVADQTVYWRIFPKGNEVEAEEGKISVESTKALTLISPAKESVIKYRNRNPQISFRWDGNEYAQNYLLKVSSTPDMQNTIISKIVEKPYTELDTIGSGEWWWQVTPYYEISSLGYADAGSSIVQSFTVEKTSGINPPSLTVPLQNAEIHYKDALNINFSWKSEIKATYDLLIAKDPDFSEIIAIKHTAGQRTNVNLAIPEKDGQEYYWKVIRNSSEADDLSPESFVRKFTASSYISVPTRLLYPPEEYSTESSKLASVRFMWKPADEAKNKESLLQISTSPDFNAISLERKTSANSLENLTLPKGEYYWRVGIENIDGNIEFTQPNHLVVQNELQTPVITNIRENAELLIAQNSLVKINWTKVEGADYYNLKVYDRNNHLITERPEATGNTVSLDLPDDSYTVKIQAVSSQTLSSPIRTGPVESVDFSVRRPTQVTALRPYASERIDGLSALRNPVNFTWKDGSDKSVTQELLLKKRQADGSLKEVERLKVSKNTVSIPRLTSGSYTWQIIASTKEGIPVNSDVNGFTVTEVASLTKPLLTSPSRNFTMDSAFLRKNRTISFEWNEVPGATEYQFNLYSRDRNGNLHTIVSERGIKGNKYRFRKLSSLDVGSFEWNVTAYAYAKDRYEEQRSETVSSSFTIKIDTPKQIQTEKSGRMFSEE